MSLGHAATEGPEALGEDIHVAVSKKGSHCRDNKIPLLVFNLQQPENMVKAVKGETVGTLVVDEK